MKHYHSEILEGDQAHTKYQMKNEWIIENRNIKLIGIISWKYGQTCSLQKEMFLTPNISTCPDIYWEATRCQALCWAIQTSNPIAESEFLVLMTYIAQQGEQS